LLALMMIALERIHGPAAPPAYFRISFGTILFVFILFTEVGNNLIVECRPVFLVAISLLGVFAFRVLHVACARYCCKHSCGWCVGSACARSRDPLWLTSVKDAALARRTYDKSRRGLLWFGIITFLGLFTLFFMTIPRYIHVNRAYTDLYVKVFDFQYIGDAGVCCGVLIFQAAISTIMLQCVVPVDAYEKMVSEESPWWLRLPTFLTLLRLDEQQEQGREPRWQQIMIAWRAAQDVYYDLIPPYTEVVQSFNESPMPTNRVLADSVSARSWHRPGYDLVDIIEDGTELDVGTDTHAYLFMGPNKEVILSFRGTTSSENLHTDVSSAVKIPLADLDDLTAELELEGATRQQERAEAIRDGTLPASPSAERRWEDLDIELSMQDKISQHDSGLLSVVVDVARKAGDVAKKADAFGTIQAVGHKAAIGKGFLRAYASVRRAVHQAVRSRLQACEAPVLVITGHSLGAALANIAALDLRTHLEGDIAMSLVTFASPATGNKHFIKMLETQQNLELVRVVHNADVIAGLGILCGHLSYTGLSHTHELVQLQEYDFLHNPTVVEEWMLEPRKTSFYDHGGDRYGRAIEAACIQAHIAGGEKVMPYRKVELQLAPTFFEEDKKPPVIRQYEQATGKVVGVNYQKEYYDDKDSLYTLLENGTSVEDVLGGEERRQWVEEQKNCCCCDVLGL